MSSRYCANCGERISSKCSFYGFSKYFSSNSSWMFIFHVEPVYEEMSERMTQLCQRCGLIFNDIYQSKIAFQNKTRGEAIMARFAVNTHTFNNSVDLNYNADKILQKQSFSMSKERDESINENDECIFPLSTYDNQETIVSYSPEGEEFSLNVHEMKQLFPKLQIAKLDAESETNNLTSLATDSLICTTCGRQFLTAERLSNHEAAVHSQNIWQYNCSFCDKTFQLEWFYKHHLKITHKGIQIQFKCDICDDKYNKEDLRSHKLQKHDIRTYPFNCNHCPESFDVISNLRDHLSNEHSGSDEAIAAVSNVKLIEIWKNSKVTQDLSCPNCQKKFTQGIFRKKHVQLEHNGECLCGCEKSFAYDKWINHSKICIQKLQLGSENCKFICEMCGKQVLSVPGLKSHYNLHLVQTRPSQYFCNLCSRSFLYQTSHYMHMKKVHSNSISIVPHKCECGKKFENNNDLADHAKNCNYVTGSFSCDKCNKKFKSSAILDGHKHWHTKKTHVFKGSRRKYLPSNFAKFTIPDGTKEVDVTLCYLSQLAQFSCPVSTCRGFYDYKSHLLRHLKEAHEIKGYTKSASEKAAVETPSIKCTDCPLLFARKDLFSIHYHRYHGTIDYLTCHVCGRQYDTNQIMHHYNRHTIAVSCVTTRYTKNKRVETNLKDLNHWYTVETQRYECSINNCANKFRLKSEFLNHCKTDHGCKISKISTVIPKFDFICTLSDCDKSYPTKLQLREHVKNHKKKKLRP